MMLLFWGALLYKGLVGLAWLYGGLMVYVVVGSFLALIVARAEKYGKSE
jgi:hypothetical protein